jgi:tetratricopeptide (TPR) repeat protein
LSWSRQELARQTYDSELGKLRRQAIEALDDGAFEQAVGLLNEIRVQERTASEQRRRNIEKARAEWLSGLQSEADTCTLLARAALSQGDVAGAVAQFQEGLQVLGPLDAESRGSYAVTVARPLYDFGDLAGRNDALAAAIEFYRLALIDRPRERNSFDWAATQNNLGTALSTLGQRESGSARLQEAVDAYEAALTVFIPAEASHYIEVCEANKAAAERLLAERTPSE